MSVQSEDELQAEIESLIEYTKVEMESPEEYISSLDFTSAYSQHYFQNQLLINMLNPDTSYIAVSKTWDEFVRQTNKGSNDIRLIAPILKENFNPEHELAKELLPYHLVIPECIEAVEFANKTFTIAIEILREELPIVLEQNFEGNSDGFYSKQEHKIVINGNPDRDVRSQYAALIRNYAYAIFYSETGQYRAYDEQTKEIQAESVAYIASKRFGMDSDYSFSEIREWAEDNDGKTLLAFGVEIQKESYKLIETIERVIVDKNIRFDVPKFF